MDGFPPTPTRRPAWEADGPAVGVYLSVPVETFFLGFLGAGEVHVFAAAQAETE